MSRDRHRTNRRARPFGNRQVHVDAALRVAGSIRRQHCLPRVDLRPGVTARHVQVLNRPDACRESRANEQIPGRDLENLLELGRRHALATGEAHRIHCIARSALHVEGDRQLPGFLLVAQVVGGRVTIALGLQIPLERDLRVLEQVLVGRAFGPHRNQAFALVFRHRIAGERHDDARASGDADDEVGIVSQNRADAGARLVKPLLLEAFFPLAERGVDVVGVVEIANADIRHADQRVGLPGVDRGDPHLGNPGAAAGHDLEYQRRAVRVVGLFDARRDLRAGIAALPIQEAEGVGRLARP